MFAIGIGPTPLNASLAALSNPDANFRRVSSAADLPTLVDEIVNSMCRIQRRAVTIEQTARPAPAANASAAHRSTITSTPASQAFSHQMALVSGLVVMSVLVVAAAMSNATSSARRRKLSKSSPLLPSRSVSSEVDEESELLVVASHEDDVFAHDDIDASNSHEA